MLSGQGKFAKLASSYAPAAGLPVLPPLAAFLELGAFIAFITLAIDWLYPGNDAFSISPNPYWIPVLLLSLQYGTSSGLLAALVAIAAYAVSGFPEAGVGEDHFTYLIRLWSEPILWVMTAVVVGQLRLRQIAERQTLTDQLNDLKSQRTALTSHVEALSGRCHMLERSLAGVSAAPAAETLAMITKLAGSGRDFETHLLEAARRIFPDAVLSVFAFDHGVLRRVAGSEWDDGARWRESFERVHPLYRAMQDNQASLSVLRPGEEAVLGSEGMLAVSIPSAAAGRPQGMLKIETLSPADLTDNATTALEFLALAVSAPLAQRMGAAQPDIARIPEMKPQPVSRLARFKFLPRLPWRSAHAAETARSETVITVSRRPKIITQ